VNDDGALFSTSVSLGTSTRMGATAPYANDAVGANELDERVGRRALGVALGVGLDVAEVTDVAVRIRGRAVGLAVGVDYGGRNTSVVRRNLWSMVPEDVGTWFQGTWGSQGSLQ
jgi:hypothetical protein